MAIIFLLATMPVFGVVNQTVDTDNSGSPTYTNLSDAIAGLPAIFTDDIIITFSGTTADISAVVNINQTIGIYHLTLVGKTDPKGVYNAGYYHFGPKNIAAALITVTSSNVTIDKIQFPCHDNNYAAIDVGTTAGTLVVKNCIFKDATGTGASAITFEGNTATATGRVVQNCVFYNCYRPVYMYRSEGTFVHNTIVGETKYGIEVSESVYSVNVVKNNLVSGGDGSTILDYYHVDYGGTVTTACNYTSDATSPDGAGYRSKTFAFVGAPDYHLNASEVANYHCTDPSISGLTTDVNGTTRGPNWTAGFHELVNAGGSNGLTAILRAIQ
jgi:hypothetical protein